MVVSLAMPAVVDVAEASQIADQHELAVLAFTEDWCDACPRLFAVLGELAGEFQDARFVEVDLANDRHAWQHFKVEALPHMVLVVRGTPIPYSGELQLEQIRDWLLETIKKKPVPIKSRQALPDLKTCPEAAFIYVGSVQEPLYDEAFAVSKMSDGEIYRSDDCGHLAAWIMEHCGFEAPRCESPSFVYLHPSTRRLLSHSLPDKSTDKLHHFMVTSTLDFPLPFSRELFTNLTRQS